MKKILVISMAVALLTSSCKNFLEKEPILTQSTEITLSTYEGLNSAIAGAYGPLVSGTWYGPGFVFEAEMRSGNGKKPTENKYNSGRYSVSYNMNYDPSSTSGLWGYGYFVISAANNVLSNLEGKEGGEVTLQDINNLKGEALFLRAFAHFDMVRLYAQPYTYKPESDGIPVVLVTDPAGMPSRNTVAQVYTQIVSDLLEAEKLMSDSYERSGVVDVKSTANKVTVQALLSRVYLYMGEWQKAADYATKVIDNKTYRMWKADEYVNVWKQDVASEGEIIFETYGDQSNGYDAYWEGPAWMSRPTGSADVAVSKDLVNLYEADDIRNTWQKDPEPGNGGNADLDWTIKYAGKGKPTADASNTVIIRLSEMYLNRAEAIVNGASINGVSAVSDLNVITSNRNASAYTSVGKEDVYNERRKELAFEGHYWFDLARWGKGVTRVDYVGDKTNQNIPFPSYMFALPIPKRECDVNKNIKQNDGY